MKEWLKPLIVSSIGGLVVAVAAYLMIVKENQVRLEFLQESVEEIKRLQAPMLPMQTILEEVKDHTQKMQDSLNATKLFVAQAHPDRDASSLTSILKLRDFEDDELFTLAVGLKNVKVGGPDHEIQFAPVLLQELIRKHELNGADITEYTEITRAPIKEPHG